MSLHWFVSIYKFLNGHFQFPLPSLTPISTLFFLLLSPITSFFTILFFPSLSSIHNIHIQTRALSQIIAFSTESIQSFHWYQSFWIFSSFSKFKPVSLATSATLHKLVNQIPSSIILSSFTVSFPQSWNNYPLSHVELNPGPLLRLWTLFTWSFDQSGAFRNHFHSTAILLITPWKFSHSMKHGSNLPILTILFHLLRKSPGYSFLHSPHLTGHGGGLALIFWSFLKFNLFRSRNLSPPESFELIFWLINFQLAIRETIFLNIYRPPSSKISTFLDEFQNLLKIFVLSSSLRADGCVFMGLAQRPKDHLFDSRDHQLYN